jgi:hypothetical protein
MQSKHLSSEEGDYNYFSHRALHRHTVQTETILQLLERVLTKFVGVTVKCPVGVGFEGNDLYCQSTMLAIITNPNLIDHFKSPEFAKHKRLTLVITVMPRRENTQYMAMGSGTIVLPAFGEQHDRDPLPLLQPVAK